MKIYDAPAIRIWDKVCRKLVRQRIVEQTDFCQSKGWQIRKKYTAVKQDNDWMALLPSYHFKDNI